MTVTASKIRLGLIDPATVPQRVEEVPSGEIVAVFQVLDSALQEDFLDELRKQQLTPDAAKRVQALMDAGIGTTALRGQAVSNPHFDGEALVAYCRDWNHPRYYVHPNLPVWEMQRIFQEGTIKQQFLVLRNPEVPREKVLDLLQQNAAQYAVGSLWHVDDEEIASYIAMASIQRDDTGTLGEVLNRHPELACELVPMLHSRQMDELDANCMVHIIESWATDAQLHELALMGSPTGITHYPKEFTQDDLSIIFDHCTPECMVSLLDRPELSPELRERAVEEAGGWLYVD